jgi:cysteine desulfurase/selenocysteine lyase
MLPRQLTLQANVSRLDQPVVAVLRFRRIAGRRIGMDQIEPSSDEAAFNLRFAAMLEGQDPGSSGGVPTWVSGNDWSRVHRLFPINETCVWLLCAQVAPTNRLAAAMVQRHYFHGLADMVERGFIAKRSAPDPNNTAIFKHTYGRVEDDIRARLSRLLHCQSREVLPVTSASFATNVVASGVNISAGDHILLVEREYPSNVYPWLSLVEKGAVIRFTPMGSSPNEFLDGFKQNLTARTKLVSIPAVNWLNGMPLPVREVGEICQKNDTLLAVDASQAIGAVELRPREHGVSFMMASAYKFLLSPPGIGVLFVAQEQLKKMKNSFVGWRSVDREYDFRQYHARWSEHDVHFDVPEDVRRFQLGAPSINDYISMDATLQLLEEIGFERVHARVRDIVNLLATRLENLGLSCPWIRDINGETASPILVTSGGNLPNDADWQLHLRGVEASARLEFLRFAPHIHLSDAQIDRAMATVADLI